MKISILFNNYLESYDQLTTNAIMLKICFPNILPFSPKRFFRFSGMAFEVLKTLKKQEK